MPGLNPFRRSKCLKGNAHAHEGIVRNDEAKAKEMVALYRRTHPGISNTDVWLVMNADNTRRANAQQLAELKVLRAKLPITSTTSRGVRLYTKAR